MARADSKSPRNAAVVIPLMRRGISFAATEMMPSPPTEISGIVQASSPLRTRNPSARSRTIDMICSRFPDASFTPMTFGISRAICSVVADVMLTPVRPGTLYMIIGKPPRFFSIASACMPKWRRRPSGVGLL